MNAITSTNKRGGNPPEGASKVRVSKKTREAIGYLAKLGCTQKEAAKLAGMNEAALSRALSKPHNQEALEAALAQRIQAITQRKELYKALAWERAHTIAQTSKDERTSLKAVELLTGGSKSGPSVSVTVNSGGGYEFAPPGARIVEIEGSATDDASSDQGAQTPAITGPNGDCET